jgi:hypothetical protein
MTLQQAAQTALDCQDACNLSGVLVSLQDIVSTVLWSEAWRLGKGTDWVNEHPIVTLMLDKLDDLNGRKVGNQSGIWCGRDNAHDQVKAIALDETRLEHDPAKAGQMDCYLCGQKIGDRAYLVSPENTPRHDICPINEIR